ncbi:DUF6445 family protein [Candidatus Rariloculus sp.]|uniref:DUF6445 family protein n=1 Tax=Candidatus Rariloculus sp. TaxID=3101265 RepID=UPI003D10EAD8
MKVVNITEREDDEIYVIDGLLSNPHGMRQIGIDAEYPQPPELPWYPGFNSGQAYPIPGLDDLMSQITGGRVKPFEGNVRAYFRLCLDGQVGKGGVHIDHSMWTGVYYLTLDEHAQGGTDFFRHLPSGALRAPVYPEDWDAWEVETVDELWTKVIRPHTNDASKWERLWHVPMKFNRAVLFRPWRWHNATPGFGDKAENGRLIYVLSYDSA